VKIIQEFSKISGLHANFDKTSVTPLGGCFSIAKEDQICKDLNLKLVTEFTLLGITFDSKLQKLYNNFEVKIIKVKSAICNQVQKLLNKYILGEKKTALDV
jgi:hypothetical protein